MILSKIADSSPESIRWPRASMVSLAISRLYWQGPVVRRGGSLDPPAGGPQGPPLRTGVGPLGDEPVPHAANRQEKTRGCWFVLYVPSEANDEVVDRARVGAAVQVPHVLEDRAPRHGLAGVLHEIPQQVAHHLREAERAPV